MELALSLSAYDPDLGENDDPDQADFPHRPFVVGINVSFDPLVQIFVNEGCLVGYFYPGLKLFEYLPDSNS